MYVYSGHTGILVDGISTGGKAGMSDMPPQVISSMRSGTGIFSHLNAVLFTHAHEDHYDRKLLGDFLSSPYGKSVKCYCPRPTPSRDHRVRNTLSPRLIGEGVYYAEVGDFRILFLDTLHQGKQYRSVYHQSILLESRGETVLFLGDGVLKENAAKNLRAFVPSVDQVFINALGLSDPGFRTFFRIVPARALQVYHVAPEEKDIYNYYAVAKSAARRLDLPNLSYDRLRPMSWLTEPAGWTKK